MNTPNNKRKRESQEKIEKAFIQLIQTKEVEQITVSDICKRTNLNRSTFYANYIDIYDLVDKVNLRMQKEFADMYINDAEAGQNPTSYLKMFKHIKENQIFYRTYFKLKFDANPPTNQFHTELAEKYYNNKHIDYHIEFFKAGLNAIIKKWLSNDCKESPEEMVEILDMEYKGKDY
ncbi:MAG: TetR/AcrR family transcriptional regulator [Clostridia bacterium]|nr:TetR/AcrR family transcriptional regulator [Clostridia bacterium]